MSFTTQQGRAFFHEFSAIASCLADKTVPIRTASAEHLGYTTEENVIYLSLTNEIYNTMNAQQGFIFLRGVFAHELLHVLITDFTKYIPAIHRHGFAQNLYANMLNILEDGSIENFAPEYLSREYTRSLEFVRAKLYEDAETINADDLPMEQFFNAMLQFRFFGFPKGKIHDKNAYRIFTMCVPLFGQCFEEPAQAKRIEYVDRIFELSRPLWEDQVKTNVEEQKRFNEMIDKLMKKYMVSENKGSGKGTDTSSPDAGKDSSINKRRHITFRRISAEEYERMAEESGEEEGALPPDGDITILIPDCTPKTESSSEEKKISTSLPDSENEQNESKDKSEDVSDCADNAGEKPSDAPDSQSKSFRSSNEQPQNGENDIDREANDNWTVPDASMTPDTYEGSLEAMDSEMKKSLILTDDEINAIQQVNERYECIEQLESHRDTDETILDLPVGNGFMDVCKKAKCQNIFVDLDASPASIDIYNSYVASMSAGITSLTSQLNRILHNRQEERMYKQNGRVSIKRLNCGRITSRVFTKRKLPNATDIAVVLAIDISGSMYGSKIAVAQKSAIALAEVFGTLNIPIYIFGFSADEHGFDVNHYHYVDWRNKKSERIRLLGVKAGFDNFDGYSIRYATELLRRKDADKKLLLVISDGKPAARAYSHVSGVQDVQLAVTESNRVATTIGILLGGTDSSIHRQMYGYNFVHCNQVNELFPQLGRILKKYI